jgi:BirA family biotin operon repressor/biotin-[acetyl-CoA-carboxylase] ligase
MPDDPSTLLNLELLQERIPPLTIRHTQAVTSTNDWAKQEVETGRISAPALFAADSQSAGRGRGTNTWWSARGNLTATLVMLQNRHIAFGLVPLLAGLAVRRALFRLTACEDIGLKWPNDLVAGGRKLAGLLCERLHQVDLIGVGVNVNAGCREAPAELQDHITSLQDLTGKTWELAEVVGRISQELNLVLSAECEDAAQEMLQEYSRHHWPTGKVIQLVDTDQTSHVSGRCVGLDAQGRILVKTERGIRSFLTGSLISVTSTTDPH